MISQYFMRADLRLYDDGGETVSEMWASSNDSFAAYHDSTPNPKIICDQPLWLWQHVSNGTLSRVRRKNVSTAKGTER
jgi:hypothetical protein